MSDTTTDPEQEPEEPQRVDPTDFGPEAVDGWRPPGTENATSAGDSQPGDPELDADAEDEPSS